MFREEPQEAVRSLRDLIEDTFVLIEKVLPDIDIQTARMRFRTERRKAWDKPPQY